MDSTQLRLVLWVATGGALGSVLRYAVSGWLDRATFPWGTFVVNLSGTALLAVIFFAALARGAFGPELRTFLFIGIFGGYTTFSTFGLETVNLLRDGSPTLAALNIGLNAGGCLLGAVGGAALGLALGGI